MVNKQLSGVIALRSVKKPTGPTKTWWGIFGGDGCFYKFKFGSKRLKYTHDYLNGLSDQLLKWSQPIVVNGNERIDRTSVNLLVKVENDYVVAIKE